MAEEIEGLTVRFGANTVDYDNSIKGMNRGLSALRKEFSNLGRELKLDPSNINTLSSRLQNLQQQAQIGAKKIADLKNQQAALNETGGPKSSEWIKLENEIQKTTGQMQVVQRAITATNKAIADLDPNSVKALEQQFENLAKELDIVDRRLKLDPKNTDAINAKVGILRQQLDNTTQRAEALRQEMAHVDEANIDSKDVQDLKLRLSEAEVQAEELKKALEKADPKSLKNIGNSVQEVGKKMTSIGKTMSTYVTAPIVAGFAAAIKVGNDFEAQMSRVGAVAGASKSELKAMTDQAIELGAKTAFSAKEAADGMENLASAGFSSKEIMEAIPGVLDLAAVSGGDVALAADNMASALRGFGLEATQSAHVSNVFARAAADTNAEVADMGEAMKYIAPVAHAMGLSIEETAAAVGIMSDAGIKGSQAGTSLRGALTRLSKPTASMYDVMTSLGLSFFDAQGKMKPLADIIGMLREKTAGLTMEQKSSAYATLFGQEALSGMLALVDAGPDKMNQLTQSFVHSDGAAKSMAQQMQDNAKSAVEQLGGAMESLGITVQQKLAPAITAIANFLSSLIEKFLNLNPVVQNVILVIVGIAAAIGPLLIGLGLLTTVIGQAIVGWGTFVSILGGIGTAISTVAGLFGSLWAVILANPIVAIVAAVAALVAGIAYLIVKTQAGQRVWAAFSSMMTTAFVTAKNAVMGALDTLVSKFNSFMTSLGGWSGIWNSIKSAIAPVGGLITSAVGPITSLADVVLKFGPALFGLLAPVGIVTKLLVNFAAAFIQTGNASDAIMLMANNFTNLVTNVASGLTTVVNGITAALPSIVNAGVQIITTLIDGIVTALPQIVNAVTQIITSLVTALTAALPGIITAGVQIITTLITAIVGALPQLVTAAVQIITGLLNALISAMPTLISAAIQIITTLVNGIVQALPMLIGAALLLITTIANGIIQLLPQIINAALQIIMAIANALIQNLPQIITAVVQLITALVNGIITLLPLIIQAALQIILALVNGLIQALPQIIAAGIQLIMALINALITLIPLIIQAALQIIIALVGALIQAIPQLLAAGVQLITALISGLAQMIPMLISAAIQLATALIQTLVDNAVNFLSAGASLIGSVMSTIWSVISSVWSNISSFVGSIVNAIASVISSVWNGIMSTISSIINGIRSVITSVWNGILSTISGILNGISSVVSGVWNGIMGVISGIVNGIRGVISGGFGAITGIVSGALNGALGAARNVIGGFASVGRNIVDAIVNSITGLGDAIAGKIRSAISAAKSAASNIIGSIFGKGSDGNINVGFGNAMGGIGSFYKVKASGMPELAAVNGGTTNSTSINIKVDAQGTDAVSIADAVERRIVRRLSF